MPVDPRHVRKVRPNPHAAELVVVYQMDVSPPRLGDEFMWEGKRYVMTQQVWPSTAVLGTVALFAQVMG